MLAHQSRNGQESKRSWVPADNSAPDWNSDGQSYLLWQEPYRKTRDSCKEDLPLLTLLRCLAMCCSGHHSPIGMQVAGEAEGSATQPCSHTGKNQEENVNLGQHAVCQALPGSNLDRFRMEAREERKWGPQNAVCLAQNLEPEWPGIPLRIYALCQLGKNRAGDSSCQSNEALGRGSGCVGTGRGSWLPPGGPRKVGEPWERGKGGQRACAIH